MKSVSSTEWGVLILAVFMITVRVIKTIRSRRRGREMPWEKVAERPLEKPPKKPVEKPVEKPGGESSRLVIHLGKSPASGGTAPSGAPARPSPRPQTKAPPKTDIESLDSIYAKNMRKKICPYCETVNSAGADVCCACGNPIEK